jgi:hypothetical protein
VSFASYTTPTPLPNRPDWKKSDWLDYFKTNHPNFWYLKELKKNYTQGSILRNSISAKIIQQHRIIHLLINFLPTITDKDLLTIMATTFGFNSSKYMGNKKLL